jgi:aspartate aminotransferase/aminotransferase
MSVSGIRKAFELSQKLENPINLSIGKPDFPTPKKLKKAAQKAIAEDKNDYSLTFGILALRKIVAEKLSKTNDIPATEKNTIITSAVSGGMSVVLPTLIDPGDEVIIFDPYFVSYKQLILLFSGVPVIVSKNEDFSVNIKALENVITNKTKVIIVNTPENPSGHVWSREELQQVADIAKKHNITIIADEIYEDFVYNKERPHTSMASIYKNTVTVGGFSKAYATTGWRVGWLHASDKIISEVMKVQQYTFVCAPTPLQYACLEAFDCDISNHISEYKTRGKILYKGLKDKYKITQLQGAFYFLLEYPYNPEKFIQDCLDKNLLIIPGEVFSEKNTHFRLSLVAPQADLHKAIKILNDLAM